MYTDDELATIKKLWETDVSRWVIAKEIGRSEGFVAYHVRKGGWKRSPNYSQYVRWCPSPRQEVWLRAAWRDGTDLAEMEAYLGVTDKAIYRWAHENRLGPRDRIKVAEKKLERTGQASVRQKIIRMALGTEATPSEISEMLGVPYNTTKNVIRSARARGVAIAPRARPKATYTDDDIKILSEGYRLGITQKTLAKLLTRGGRPVSLQMVAGWGNRTRTNHRNGEGRFILCQLSPDRICAYVAATGNDPVDLVQLLFRVSRKLTPKMASGALRDYYEAISLFPELPNLCRGYVNRKWFVKYHRMRAANVELDEWRCRRLEVQA